MELASFGMGVEDESGAGFNLIGRGYQERNGELLLTALANLLEPCAPAVSKATAR